jgi:hypothetical protein
MRFWRLSVDLLHLRKGPELSREPKATKVGERSLANQSNEKK